MTRRTSTAGAMGQPKSSWSRPSGARSGDAKRVRSSAGRRSVAVLALAGLALAGAGPVAAEPEATHRKGGEKRPVAEGFGGAVATADHDATKAGIEVLRRGGNAVDAAVASAAALGVTEPFSAGIGGGGFFLYYEAATGTVHTIDGRETAPAAATEELFLDPESGEPLPFDEARVSGLSIGVPGTPATWDAALSEWGTWPLGRTLAPAIRIAERGFEVDATFRSHVEMNTERFSAFTSSRDLYLPGGAPPVVGSVFTNRDLAGTYRILAREGTAALYDGRLGEELARTVQEPPVAPDTERVVRSGAMTADDLRAYRLAYPEPTRVEYAGHQVFGMAPPSSGGSTVGETLNILSEVDPDGETDTLHTFLEAGALSFADRNRYVGDPAFVDVPLAEMLSPGFAAERACEIDQAAALPRPVAPGDPDGDYTGCDGAGGDEPGGSGADTEGLSTTHLSTADRWGNVVSYTLTIESTGGSTIVVPGRGYLLNNELTDFTFAPSQGEAPEPNLPGPGKRPRSSMSPTLVLDSSGQPVLAVGTPGGTTIITTVSQILLNRLGSQMHLLDALAAPRASQRNVTNTLAEPEFLASPVATELAARGHQFSETDEIGAATGLEILRRGPVLLFQAVAEPVRRGGGSAMVPWPVRR